MVVALVCAAGVGLSAGAAAGHVDSTIRVDNPYRPPDWVCEDDAGLGTETTGSNDTDDAFGEGCDQPKQVSFPLGPFARGVVSGQTWVAFFAVAFAWPVAAGFFDVFAGTDGGF